MVATSDQEAPSPGWGSHSSCPMRVGRPAISSSSESTTSPGDARGVTGLARSREAARQLMPERAGRTACERRTRSLSAGRTDAGIGSDLRRDWIRCTAPSHPGSGCRVAAGSHPARGPHQIRTRRFPPSGSSAITSHGRAPQMRTMMRGRGSPRASSLNRAQVRRQRLLRRRSHLNHALLAQWFSAEIARPFPLTAK
jgi:hypothetical protein